MAWVIVVPVLLVIVATAWFSLAGLERLWGRPREPYEPVDPENLPARDEEQS